MEIEVVTTKKKLSLALVKQMLPATLDDLAMVELYPDRVLGYVVIKNEKIALLKGVDDWKQLNISHDWIAAKHSAVECVSRNRFVRFENSDQRDLFLARYAALRGLATTHIYL